TGGFLVQTEKLEVEIGLRQQSCHSSLTPGGLVKIFLRYATLLTFIAASFWAAHAQTFEINGQSQDQTQAPAKGKKGAASTQSSNSMSWGSGIGVGRYARAAETALGKGDNAAAANYAERAVQEAPQDAHLWFLLGYTSRLAGKNDRSIQAFERGLQLQPGSVEGLSGMAQTYAKMGRVDQAKKLLLEVIAANPKRENDLLIAGELFMQTGDVQRGLELLQRAESMHPSSHAELLMAVGYMKLKQ